MGALEKREARRGVGVGRLGEGDARIEGGGVGWGGVGGGDEG